jgi:SPP1 family predicted phage head-tail adaptor
VKSGRLRHHLTFERQTTEKDSDGEDVDSWGDAFTTSNRMPCEVEALSGRELIAAQSVHSRVTTRITTRYRPGFAADMRATGTDGTIYDLLAVIPDADSRRRSVTLLAASGINAGGSAT